MSALIEFVRRENSYISNFLAITRPLDLQNAADRQKIAKLIDLAVVEWAWDNESSVAQAKTRYKALTEAAAELQKLDSSVTFYEFWHK